MLPKLPQYTANGSRQIYYSKKYCSAMRRWSIYFNIRKFGNLLQTFFENRKRTASGRISKTYEKIMLKISKYGMCDGDVLGNPSASKVVRDGIYSCDEYDLGETLDIHTGGVDLIFPTNEIAQSGYGNCKILGAQ